GRKLLPAGDVDFAGQPDDLFLQRAGWHDHDAWALDVALATDRIGVDRPAQQPAQGRWIGNNKRQKPQEDTMLRYVKAGMASAGVGAGAVLAGATTPAQAQGWEPSKPVEFIVPAGTGGGADQMARFIQGVVAKHNLMKQPMVVINKPGGAGAEGFLEIKGAAKDPHKIVITLSNLFTTPLGTGVPFNWKDLTPLSMLALDQFVLWVNSEAPFKSAKDYLDAVKGADDRKFKMGGTGSKQEDQIITVALERLTTPKKLTYVPFKGGGDVAVQLVGKHIDSSVNNPIEAV